MITEGMAQQQADRGSRAGPASRAVCSAGQARHSQQSELEPSSSREAPHAVLGSLFPLCAFLVQVLQSPRPGTPCLCHCPAEPSVRSERSRAVHSSPSSGHRQGLCAAELCSPCSVPAVTPPALQSLPASPAPGHIKCHHTASAPTRSLGLSYVTEWHDW